MASMRGWWSDMNATVRGFVIVLAIAAAIFVLNLEGAILSLALIFRIVFFIAIAVVLYMFWRDRMRHQVEMWSDRSRWVFYGSALLILVDLALFFWPGTSLSGFPALAFVLVLMLCGYAMYRVWHSERIYS
jgi:ABC-type xylose transport system permease subunit